MNPFQYGKVVSDPYFVDRKKELLELGDMLRSGNNLILHAPRRYGKTSLIMKLLSELDTPNTVYIDLFSVTSIESFINIYANAVLKTRKASVQDIVKKLGKLLRGVSPTVSFDSSGNPTWSFQFTASDNRERSLVNILDLPHEMAMEGERYYVVFDEFQEINRLNGDSFEKQLRASIQHHDNVSYVFMGSKTHLLLDMFNSKNRALYHCGGMYALDKIPRQAMLEFLFRRFKESRVEISEDILSELIQIAHNIPYYNQYLAAQLWQVCREMDDKDFDKMLSEAVLRILGNQNDFYLTLYDHLTIYQRSVLKAITHESSNVFSQEYHRRHGLTSPSSTQRAVSALIEYGILEKIGDHYHFSDPFFTRWLQLRNYA
ncbi:MAG: ATP-binding protein [Candidatus Cloacimonetes bacterium]|nr:ATP-binding protein [Candidatus Cloacimonadota bacterium]